MAASEKKVLGQLHAKMVQLQVGMVNRIKNEGLPVTEISVATKNTTLSMKILEINRHNQQQPGGLKQHKTGGWIQSRIKRREKRAATRSAEFHSPTSRTDTDSIKTSTGEKIEEENKETGYSSKASETSDYAMDGGNFPYWDDFFWPRY